MKKYLLILIAFQFIACEDVIEVDLPVEEPRLVIDAVLRVDKSEMWVGTQVKTSLSAGYFESIQPTQVESVTIVYGIEDDQGFMETTYFSNLVERPPGTGVYQPDLNSTRENRISTSLLNPSFTFYLLVRYNDKLYVGKTKYVPTVPIDNLEQGDGFLFDEDETEVIITYTDDGNRDDFYVFDFDFGSYLVSEDDFYNGQQFSFSYYYDINLEPGQLIEVSIMGADRQFFNYMDLIIEQTEALDNPFGTPAATIRGNIFEATGIDNNNQFDNTGDINSYPLGYFAVVQTYTARIFIE